MDENGSGWVQRRVGVADGQRRSATFIDAGAEFEGTLRLTESFRIDGEFRGAIFSESTVIVGEAAGIVANIRARDVVVSGAVQGDIVATRQLTLRAGAKLHGNVETPSLEVERGAVFNGSTRMVRPEVAARDTARPVEAEGTRTIAAPPTAP